MQHKMSWLLAAAFLFLPLAAQAQTAEEEIAALAEELKDAQTFRAAFTQDRHLEALSRPLRSSGRLVFSKERGIAWIVEEPYPAFMVLTQEHVIEWEEGGPRTAVPLSARPHLAVLAGILPALVTADIAELEKEFRIETGKTEKGWEMELRPRDEALARALVSIQVAGDDAVRSVGISEQGGDRTQIVFEGFTAGPPALTEKERSYFAE